MAFSISRRRLLAAMAAAGLITRFPPLLAQSGGGDPITKAIPATGESVPVIGMGTWRTFNVGEDPALLDQRTRVLEAFFRQGGSVIDSSPMYGTAEAVLGRLLPRLDAYPQTFAATKVWTRGQQAGREQMAESRRLWGVERFDLMQIHNLVDWQTHLDTLKQMKADGEIRYLGITTSHGRRLGEFEDIMASEPLDFVQLTYNIVDRWAEERLLPLARERGIAVIANRPFQGGRLFSRFQSEPLPEWAGEAGCSNWAEFFLKFIVSHPALTCAIPATTSVEHMNENMGAQFGRLPDPQQRARMVRYVEAL
ncbi:MAG: aldo/keto reductase [Marinobacter sp.]|uniref:aldo/keto reductase n=1 Tax=Marinobacter sp. TaxID=50741 RepID=UPI00299D4E61|nr:aldo/keto reductase [Marinobacter sp.]MDX1634909.1 aldo/keto reductase [Marinobacter sp.]